MPTRPTRRSALLAIATAGVAIAAAQSSASAQAPVQNLAPAPSPVQPPLPVSSALPLAYDFVPSPNFEERPAGVLVSCIVLHATVEPTTQGTVNIFLDGARAAPVSAHFVVGKDGRVVQMVPVEKRAWHAGGSMLAGVTNVNNFSVGIEMVNLNDGKDPYPEEQYRAVAGIIRLVRSRYDVPDERIVSHAVVATNAGRSDKTDPAGFDFVKVCALAKLPPAPAV